MGMNNAAAIFITGTGHEVDVSFDADALREELEVDVFEHRRLGLTALVAQTNDQQRFDAAAKKLARKLNQRTWAVMQSNEWLEIVAFENDGKKRWSVEGLLDAPYRRLAAELPGKPKKPLWDLGIDLELVKPWVRLRRIDARFSPEYVAAREAEKKLAEAERRELEARAAAVEVANAHWHAEQTAKRKAEAELEARTLLNTTVSPGVVRVVQLPAAQHKAVEKLVKTHGVDAAWVWQAAAAQSTPWKFPPSALPAVPLTNPREAALVVSPALQHALDKSSLTRPDGTPASFDELVRVAISLGLDGLKDELKENARKRKKLERS